MSKLLTEEEVVGQLRSGMTIGIGGWGSRRKPMSIVRAIARSDLTDLTIVCYAGPDLGLLCAAGKVRRAVYAFASLDSIPLEPHFRAARQAGLIEDEPYDEGLFLLGLQAAAWRVPFLPTRVGLGSDLLRLNPRLRTVDSPYDDGESFVAAPALSLDAAICHLNVRRRPRQRRVPRARPLLRRPVPAGGDDQPVHLGGAGRTDGGVGVGGGHRASAADQPADGRRRRPRAERRALHLVRSRVRARRGVPARVRRLGEEPGGVGRVPGERGWTSDHRGADAPTSARWPSPSASAATARSSPTRSARSR